MPLAATLDLPDRYRVVRHIASGGMASVWEVEDLLLGRLVAVKVLGAQFAADPGARERFQREARTAAQVSDQTHVVTIYDIGEHGDDAFIVMEHFAGGTVADRLRAARDAGERIPRETALRWLREAATGLDVAHAAGIVHRDVKPANLLLDAQDRLAVGDFGIARLADDTQMTMTGQVLGTAAYISPEQALGQPATDASDRYALAVVAYELLTGSRPFAGGPPSAQARQHAEAQPARASEAAPGLPPAVDDVLARGLAKDPARRPRSATELVAALESALDGGAGIEPTRPFEPTAATERPRTPPAPPPVRRLRPSPPPAAAGAAGAAGAAAAAAAAAEPALGADGASAAAASPSPAGRSRGQDSAGAAGAARGQDSAGAAGAARGQGSAGAAGAARGQGSAGAAGAAPAPGSAGAAGAARGPGSARSGDAARGPGRGPARAAGGAPLAPRARRGPMPALLVATLAVAAVIALVLVLAGGRDDPSSRTADRRTSTSEGSRTSTTAAAAPQPPPPPPAPQPASAGGEKPAALHARAFALVKQGRYGEALAPAQAAVQGYRDAGETGGLPYAYALFNYAVALNRSGNPAAAIPLLQERLKFNDQRATVQAELDDALAKTGQAAPAGGNGKAKGNGKKDKGDR